MAGVADPKNVHMRGAGEQARDRRFPGRTVLGPRLGPLSMGTDLGFVTEWQLEAKASGSPSDEQPACAPNQGVSWLGAAADALR